MPVPSASNLLPVLLIALAACQAEAQVPPRTPGRPPVDVQDYAFEIEVADTTDRIRATATVALVATGPGDSFWLDLVGVQPDGTGMRVERVTEGGVPVPFTHAENRLTIRPEAPLVPGANRTFAIAYAGVPSDGLIVSTNRHGDRTFFGDNWPERARHWLPVVDHPSDKATVTWDVTAPGRVRIVANGRRVSDETLADGRRRALYRSDVPLPTKVMVFGAAPFAVEEAGRVRGVPVESWVYAQDEAAGFYDFALAVPITAFFDSLLAPFPFEKLASVQSKTRYGGMENAGAIFYNEGAVRGDRAAEPLIVHEIAHQWFGNHATEADWPHLWLSEGFATYLTAVYLEKTHGVGRSRALLREARAVVLDHSREHRDPLVDTTYADPNELLNANAYQRGAWVLHMLRQEMARSGAGDEAFFEGLRRYLARFGGGIATTDSLQRVMESVAGRSLEAFFAQWTRRPGQPALRGTWRWLNDEAEIVLDQVQEGAPFRFPLEIGFVYPGGDTVVATVEVREKTFRTRIKGRNVRFSTHGDDFEVIEPSALILDPHVNLLFRRESFGEAW